MTAATGATLIGWQAWAPGPMALDESGAEGRVEIHTDRLQYAAGETVRGTVSFTLPVDEEIQSATLTVVGVEETEFLQPASAESTATVDRVAVKDRGVFFDRQIMLDVEGASGQAHFELALDADLPGTFSFSNKTVTKALIRYAIWVDIKTPTANLKHSQELFVAQARFRKQDASAAYKEMEVGWCCLPQGALSLAASVDKESHQPGELVRVKLVADNTHSALECTGLLLRLERTLTLSAQGTTHSETTVMLESQFEGVARGERHAGTETVCLASTLFPTTDSSLVRLGYGIVAQMQVPWSEVLAVEVPVYVAAVTATASSPQLPAELLTEPS